MPANRFQHFSRARHAKPRTSELWRVVLALHMAGMYLTMCVPLPQDETSACSLTAGLTCGLQDFSKLYADIFTPIDTMVAQQQLLRSAGLPTYICSNSSELHIQHVRDTYPFFSG